MKNVWIICFLLLCVTPAGSMQAEPSDPKALARQALATRTLAQEARALLSVWAAVDEDPAQWIDSLTRAMLDEPASYAAKEPGRDAALRWVTERRRQQFAERMERAWQTASEQSPLPVSLEQALTQADPAWARRRDEAASKFAAAWIETLYTPAREQAVERQRTRLAAEQTYPGFDELDPRIIELDRARNRAMTPLDASRFQALDAWLRPRITDADGPLFDETTAWLGEVVVAMRLHIARQYQHQVEALAPFWQEGRFPDAPPVRDAYRAAMEAHVARRVQPDSDARPPVYPVFTAVSSFIEDAAAYWEARRLADFLSASGSVWRPDFDAVNTWLAEDATTDSQALARQWADRVRSEVAAAYTRASEQAGSGERLAYFEGALEREGAFRHALEAYVHTPIEQALDSLERQLTQVRELEQDWHERLQADVLRGERVERILRNWTREWEQRWARASGEVNKEWHGMFDRTRDALNKTVRQWYAAVEASPASTADTQATATGDADPESNQPASESMTPIDRPMETPGEQDEPVPAMEGAGEGEEMEAGMAEAFRAYRGVADGVLAFSDLPDGRCRLQFGAPDGTGARSVEFDPADVEAAAAQIAALLRAPLREALDDAVQEAGRRRGFLFFTRDRPSELRMLFRVGSPAIRHQMSILIRQHLDEEIQIWSRETGQPAPTLLWQEEAMR